MIDIAGAAPSPIRSLVGALPSAERARIIDMLADAGDDARSVGRTSTSPGNHAGTLSIGAMADAIRGADLLFVTKPVQGAAEVAGSEFAALMGIDHLVPIAVAGSDDSARMVFARGESADAAGVTSPAQLRALRERGLQVLAPTLDAARRAQQARMEVELAQVFDYLLANSDRRGRNLLVDVDAGTFALIDNASIGHGDMFMSTPLRPRLKATYQGEGGVTTLESDTIEWLRSHLDERQLAAWHASHAGAHALKLDTLIQRFRGVLEHGSFRFDDGASMRTSNDASMFVRKTWNVS